MKNIPKLFGFPLWRGRIKRRVIKKIFSKCAKSYMFEMAKDPYLSMAGIGSLVSACAGLNEKIDEIIPVYWRINKKGCEMLFDIDFQSETNGFSLAHCGVGNPLTYEQALAYRQQAIDNWAKIGDPYKFVERCKKTIINPDGTYINPPREE